jgi:lipopolysaccharide transport system permease protein
VADALTSTPVTESGAQDAFETGSEPESRPQKVTVMDGGRVGLRASLREIVEFPELVYFLVWRDVKVRYKQTVMGASWAILQPLTAMLIFSLVFGVFVKVNTGDIPYPVFSYAGLLPWLFFSQAVLRGSSSLVGSQTLVSKVYFPRLIIPIAALGTPLVDLGLSFLVLIPLMACYGMVPTIGIVALPLFVLLAMGAALAVVIWFSALNVKYRDVGFMMPFLLQMWMYASPVAYPVTAVPQQWRLLYSLNPMVGVIEGFRWAIFGSTSPNFGVVGVSTAVVVVLIAMSLRYFSKTERMFADVI